MNKKTILELSDEEAWSLSVLIHHGLNSIEGSALKQTGLIEQHEADNIIKYMRLGAKLTKKLDGELDPELSEEQFISRRVRIFKFLMKERNQKIFLDFNKRILEDKEDGRTNRPGRF